MQNVKHFLTLGRLQTSFPCTYTPSPHDVVHHLVGAESLGSERQELSKPSQDWLTASRRQHTEDDLACHPRLFHVAVEYAEIIQPEIRRWEMHLNHVIQDDL